MHCASHSSTVKSSKRPDLSDEAVLGYRRAVLSREMTRRDVEVETGLSSALVQRMLTGGSYKKIPEPVPVRFLIPPRYLTDEQVIEARNAFRSGELDTKGVGKKYNLDYSAVGPMLRGRSYADVPGAVTQVERATSQRANATMTDEQVLYWRRRYLNEKGRLSHKCIAKILDASISAVSAMLTGKNYGHVPEAVPANFAAQNTRAAMLTPRQVHNMRRRYDPPATTVRDLAKAYKLDQKATAEILNGTRFPDVPGAVEIITVIRRLTDEEVIECRALIRDKRISIAKLAKRFKVDDSAMASIVRGRTYAHLPGAVPGETRAAILARARNRTKADPSRPTLFRLPDDEVLALRRRYNAGKGKLTSKMIATEIGASIYWVRKALSGVTYKHLPEPVSFYKHRPTRVFDDSTALKIRATYSDNLDTTIDSLAVAYEVASRTISNCLLGYTYKDLPGALDKLRSSDTMNSRRNLLEHARRFEPEVVLIMRLNYAAGHTSIEKLARQNKVAERTIRFLLRGDTYADVPEAIDMERKARTTINIPDIPDEQVLAMRQIFATGMRTVHQIAVRLGIKRRECLRMLNGRTHGHIAGAVDVQEKPRPSARRKKGGRSAARVVKPIKFVPPRLLDHDERVDLVTFRESRG